MMRTVSAAVTGSEHLAVKNTHGPLQPFWWTLWGRWDSREGREGKKTRWNSFHTRPVLRLQISSTLECCLYVSVSSTAVYTATMLYRRSTRTTDGLCRRRLRSGQARSVSGRRPAEQSYYTYDIARTPVITGNDNSR